MGDTQRRGMGFGRMFIINPTASVPPQPRLSLDNPPQVSTSQLSEQIRIPGVGVVHARRIVSRRF
jgi:predicted DNA-binding helix-hairpin-helix protein